MGIDAIRKETFNEMLEKLRQEPHLVAVPRPTGFGKTFMSTDLIKKGGYKNILYVYPTEIIKTTVIDRYYADVDDDTLQTYHVMRAIKGVTLMTYKRLSMLREDDVDLIGYDLVIFDECHRMGALRTLPKAELLKRYNPGIHMVGLTATPNRSDGYDIIEKFFGGITVKPYTLHDAFKDGLYKVPVYCYLHGEESKLEDRILEEAFMAGEDIDNLRVKKVIKKKVIEMARLYDVKSGIKETCDAYVDTNYMKFICFFSTHNQLLKKSKRVVNWFKSVYPDHNVNTIEISSRKRDTAENVAKLGSLQFCDNHIDLILCVDMLNMGYHVDNITGIIMYRTTSSDIIYPQQYGRVLASGSERDHIIFDIVDNLHRKIKQQQRKTVVIPPTIPPVDGPGVDVPPIIGVVDVPPITGGYTGTGGKSIGIGGNGIGGGKGTGADVPPENPPVNVPPVTGGDDTGTKKPWWKDVSDLNVIDLRLAKYSATYKEQIAKLVAEPMQIRCKEAFEAHFKRWCIMNGYKYPVTNKELNRLYGVDKKEFIEYFENLIKENNLDYPMRDAQKLLDIGKTRQDGLPMDIFAKWKNVSIANILDLLEVS